MDELYNYSYEKLSLNSSYNSEYFKDQEQSLIISNNKDFNDNKIDDILRNSSNYEFISLINIIYRKSKKNDSLMETADYFLNVYNRFYISGGFNAPLIYYDEHFNKKPPLKIKLPKNIIYKIYEGINNCQIIGLFKNKIKSYRIKPGETLEISETNLNIKEIKSCYSFIKMGKDDYILCNQEGIFLIENMFNQILPNKVKKILNNIAKGGIKLGTNEDNNNSSFAFFSNSVANKGEDKLFFSSIHSKIIDKEISGYSIILSSNSLSIMKIYENKKNKKDIYELLLCSCKKYKKKQKNGILLVDLKKENNYKCFYNTGNFEVYCCCQLLKIHNKNPFTKDIKDNDYTLNIDKIYTKYFLVGGFDTGKYQGLIKLYKIIMNKKNDSKFKIQFIQNIVVDNHYIENDYNYSRNIKFHGPISSIIQSEITGNIVATCWDGNIYLFSPPNIEGLEKIMTENYFID